MTPSKHAILHDQVSRWVRDMQVAPTRATDEWRCLLWRVIGTIACCFLAKLVLGPPHHHDAFQTCNPSRSSIAMGPRYASRTDTSNRRVEMPLVACDWDYRVLFSGQVGAWS